MTIFQIVPANNARTSKTLHRTVECLNRNGQLAIRLRQQQKGKLAERVYLSGAEFKAWREGKGSVQVPFQAKGLKVTHGGWMLEENIVLVEQSSAKTWLIRDGFVRNDQGETLDIPEVRAHSPLDTVNAFFAQVQETTGQQMTHISPNWDWDMKRQSFSYQVCDLNGNMTVMDRKGLQES